MVAVCFIGAAKTGKTAVLNNLMGLYSLYDDCYRRTLGADVGLYKTGEIMFNIWDCAGDPRHIGIAEGYLRVSDIIVVFGDAAACPVEYTKVDALVYNVPAVTASNLEQVCAIVRNILKINCKSRNN